jgi:DNA-binding NtrC family response regulator
VKNVDEQVPSSEFLAHTSARIRPGRYELEVISMSGFASPGCGAEKTGPRLEVLTINNEDRDCSSLQSIIRHTNWVFHCVPDLAKALEFLNEHFVPVIVCSKELPDATWKDVLVAVAAFPIPPKVLVHSHQADDAFWMEVLKSGAYDLLPVPFNAEEVLRLVSLACRKWKDDEKIAEKPHAVEAAG